MTDWHAIADRHRARWEITALDSKQDDILRRLEAIEQRLEEMDGCGRERREIPGRITSDDEQE